jgi:hypothetical protein
MPVLSLQDWAGQNSGLSPTPQGASESIMSLLKNAIGGFQKKQQDQQFRDAIKKEMGIDVPQGVDAQKLYETIIGEKAKAQADPETQMFNRMFGDTGGQPGGTPPAAPNDNAMPGTTPATPVAPQINQSQLLRGMMSKKFGVPYEQMMTPEEKAQALEEKRADKLQDIELKSIVTPQKQKEDLQKAQLAEQNLTYLEEKTKKLPSGYGAIGSNISNFIGRGGFNPELALYEKQMPAMAVAIYREITGDTRLSDADAEARALPLLWDARKGENEAIKRGVFVDLKKLYKARIDIIKRGAYKPNPKDPSEMITPLEDVMAKAGVNKQNNGTQMPTPGAANQDKIAQAKAAGYTDAEIQAYLNGR